LSEQPTSLTCSSVAQLRTLLATREEIRRTQLSWRQYSLGGHRDVALVEYCVKFDSTFTEHSFRGVPDIRVIVFRGYPVLGMVRLPTRRSHGEANLHQGAVGAGLDLAGGRTT